MEFNKHTWSLSGNTAVTTYAGLLLTYTSHTSPVCFTVDARFTGLITITNTAEISQSEDMVVRFVPDLDYVADSINNETGIVDNEINGSGPKSGEDEDGYDITPITVISPTVFT